MQAHIGQLMAQLATHSVEGRPVDIRKWLTFSMFDINSDFSFGEDMGCVKGGSFHEWVQFVVDYFYAATLFHQCYKFWPLNRLLAMCIPRSVRQMQKSHSEASLRRVRKRIASQTDRHDFMFYFMRQAEKEQLSPATIEAQATVMILAGSETTSVAETAAMYRILAHSLVYERLVEEIRRTFATVEEIKLHDVLHKLPYLDAVVQETLRIHAPLANGFSRWIPERDGAVICGRPVPQGVSIRLSSRTNLSASRMLIDGSSQTVVTINHYCSNTSSRNFRNPAMFVPERWMDDADYADDKREVVQPFSVGPRNCPGRK